MNHEILLILAIILACLVAKLIAAFMIASKRVPFRRAKLISKMFSFELPSLK